jgi:hypothetical protein
MNEQGFPNISSEQMELVLRLLKVADQGIVSFNNELLTRPCASDGLQQTILSWLTSWLQFVLEVEDRAAAIINSAHEQEPTAENASVVAIQLAQVAAEGLAWRVFATKVLFKSMNSMAPNAPLSDVLNAWSTAQNEITDWCVAVTEAVEAGRPAGQLLH